MDEDDAWMLSRADHDLLYDVVDELWKWKPYCKTGRDLLGLGAVLAAVESVLAREMPTTYAQVSLTHRPEIGGEGRSVIFEHGDPGFELSDIVFVPTGQGESADHHSSTAALLDPNGSFNRGGVMRWIETAAEVRGMGSAVLHAYEVVVPE